MKCVCEVVLKVCGGNENEVKGGVEVLVRSMVKSDVILGVNQRFCRWGQAE